MYKQKIIKNSIQNLEKSDSLNKALLLLILVLIERKWKVREEDRD